MATRTDFNIRASEAFFSLPDVSDVDTQKLTITSSQWYGQVFLSKSNELQKIFFLCDDTEGLEIRIHKAILGTSNGKQTYTPGQLVASLLHEVDGVNPFVILPGQPGDTAFWHYPNWLATPQTADDNEEEYIIVFRTSTAKTPNIYYTFNYRQTVFPQIIGWDGESWSNGNVPTKTVRGTQIGSIISGYVGDDLSDTNFDSGTLTIGGRDSARRGYPVFILVENITSQNDKVAVKFSQISPSDEATNGTAEETSHSMMQWYFFPTATLPITKSFNLKNARNEVAEFDALSHFALYMQPDLLSPFADTYFPEAEIDIQSNSIGIVPIYEGMPVRHGRTVLDFDSKKIIESVDVGSPILEVSDPLSRQLTNYNSRHFRNSVNDFGRDFWGRFEKDKVLTEISGIRDAENSQNPDYIDFSIEPPDNEIDLVKTFTLTSDPIDGVFTEEFLTRGFNKIIFYSNKYIFFGKKITSDVGSGTFPTADTKIPLRICDENLLNFERKEMTFTDSTPTTLNTQTQMVGVLDVEVLEVNGTETLIFLFQSNQSRTATVPDIDKPFFEVGYYQGDFSEAEINIQMLKEEDPSLTLTNFANTPSISGVLTEEQNIIDDKTVAKLIKPTNLDSVFITASNDVDGLGLWEIKSTDNITSASYEIPLVKPNPVNETGLATTDDKRISFVLKDGGTTYIGTRVPDGKVSSIYRTDDFVNFEQLFGGDSNSSELLKYSLNLNINETRFMFKSGNILHAWISPVDYDATGTPVHVGIDLIKKEAKILRKFPILDDGDTFYSSLPKISDLEYFPRSKAVRLIQGGTVTGNQVYIFGADKLELTSGIPTLQGIRWLIYDDRIINHAMDFPENPSVEGSIFTVTNGNNSFQVEPIRIEGLSAFDYYKYDEPQSSGFIDSPYTGSVEAHPLASEFLAEGEANFMLFIEDDGSLKLITVFGIEGGSGGNTNQVDIEYSGLPSGANEEFRDDTPTRDPNDSTDLNDLAQGKITNGWVHSDDNTDGGIILGLENGGEWTININIDNSAPVPGRVRHSNWFFMKGQEGATNATTGEVHGVGSKETLDETKVISISRSFVGEGAGTGVYTGKTISTIKHDETSKSTRDYPEFLPDPSEESKTKENTPRGFIYCGIINYGELEDDSIDKDNSNISKNVISSNGVTYMVCDNINKGMKVFKTYGVKQLPSEWGKYFKDSLKEDEASGNRIALTTTNANKDNFDYVDLDKAAYERTVSGEENFKSTIKKAAVNKVNGVLFVTDFRDNKIGDTPALTGVASSSNERTTFIVNNGVKEPQFLSSFYRFNYIGNGTDDLSDIMALSDPETSETILSIKGAETADKLFSEPSIDIDLPLSHEIGADQDRSFLKKVFSTDIEANFFRFETPSLFDRNSGERRIELQMKNLRVFDVDLNFPEEVTASKKVAINGIVGDPGSYPENLADESGSVILPTNGEIIVDFVKPIYINEVSFFAEFISPDIVGLSGTEFEFSIISNLEKRSETENIISNEDWLVISSKYYGDLTTTKILVKDNISSYVQALRIRMTSGETSVRMSDLSMKSFISGFSNQFVSSGSVSFPELIVVDDIVGLLELNTPGIKPSSFASFKSNNSYVELDMGENVPISKISMNVVGDNETNTRTIQVDVWDGETLDAGEEVFENVFTGPVDDFSFSLVRWVPRQKDQSRKVEVEFLDSAAPYTPDPLLTDDNIGLLLLDFNNISNSSGLLTKSGLAGWAFKPDVFTDRSITVLSSENRLESGNEDEFVDDNTDGFIVVNAQMDEDGPFFNDIEENSIGMLVNNLNVDFPLKNVRKIRVTVRNQKNGNDAIKINGLRVYSPLVDKDGNAISPVSTTAWDIRFETVASTEK